MDFNAVRFDLSRFVKCWNVEDVRERDLTELELIVVDVPELISYVDACDDKLNTESI